MMTVEKKVAGLLEDGLEPLLLSVLDQSASEEEFGDLVDSLRASEELRRRACRFLCDESLLTELVGATQRASQLVEALSTVEAERSPESIRLSSRSPLRYAARFADYVNGHGMAVAALAAIAVAALFVQNVLVTSKLSRLHELAIRGDAQPAVGLVETPNGGGPLGARVGESTKVVGHVIGLDKVGWDPEQKELPFGDALREGQRLQLESGGLEILLANGAKITAEGPVDFELSSLVTMDVGVGKVVAAVPRTARGYTIFTPTTEIVDIGTQFGVSVSESGDTELHVFDGDVVARSLLDSADSNLVHAKENEALEFHRESPTPRRVDLREAEFRRQLGPRLSGSDLPALPVSEDLSLWFAADLIRDAREGEPVSVWRDVLVGDNIFANDARQLVLTDCPTFEKDRDGRAAIRFDGVSDHLMIDPIECDESSTVFVVCRPQLADAVDPFHGGIFYKHGNAPSLELSVQRNHSTRAWLWPGPDEERVAVATGALLSGRLPHVIAYRYDADAGRARLWTDGVRQADSGAPIGLSNYAPACLGGYCGSGVRASFSGSIYEVVVFDAALNEESMNSLINYFAERYLTQ